jgi:polygalacturonase
MLVRPTRRELLKAGGALAGAALVGAGGHAQDAWGRAAHIVASVRPPKFPSCTFPITEYGARGDGGRLATDAIARAIAACAAAGGGRVLVPAGRFLTGAVHLRSNVELHVARGATLLFSTDPADYPLVRTRWEGLELINYSPLLYAYGQRNIAVTGEGTLDGQASASRWWSWKGPWQGTVDNGWRQGMPDQRPARARLAQMAEAGVPVEKRVFGDGSYLRPAFIEPYRCENVVIEGVKLRGAPFWQVHPVLCRNVIVRNLDVQGHGPNNDGCDPESCSMVLIEGCTFDTGDDCIAVKSGRNADGRRLRVASEDIVIRNCRMKEGHGGLTIGSEISGGARRVFAEHCVMDSPNLHFALRFKNNAARGGLLEDFYFRDIRVGHVAEAAIACDFNYEEGASGPYVPILQHIRIEGLRATHVKRVLNSQGLPGAPVRDIVLSDCRFDGVAEPSVVRFTDGLVLRRVLVNGRSVASLS